jgi:methionyl-tRNA synthetase
VYVWFDALINYLAAAGFPDAGYERLWPADLHVVGKGITRFHCVIWPAMLIAAGIELPREVWAHGYVQWEGTKMSKTAGTAVTLDDAIARYGPDPLRYFLLREVGFEADGNFSWERYDERYTADLADGLGNLASRALQMIVKYRGGVVPDGEPTSLDEAGTAAVERYAKAMDALDLRAGAEAAWSLVGAANLYVQTTAPWSLAKAGRDAELDAALAAAARALYRLAVLTAPFMPGKARELWSDLGQRGDVAAAGWASLAHPAISGRTVAKPAGLFPKPLAV